MSEKDANPTKLFQKSQPGVLKPARLTIAPVHQPKKLHDQVSQALRTKHYAYRTEETFVDWIKRYIIFHKKTPPKRHGPRRDPRIHCPPRHRTQSHHIHPKSGPQRHPLSIPHRPSKRYPPAARTCKPIPPQTPAHGTNSRRSLSSPWLYPRAPSSR